MTYRILTLGPLVLLGACGSLLPVENVICTTSVEPGLEIQVRDARTGAPAAAGVVAIARDGAYTDTLRVAGWNGPPGDSTATTVAGASERPGTYDIRIQKPGYRAWERTGVRVRDDECHVVTVRLDVLLEPAS